MNNRIAELRKTLKKSQAAFAQDIKVSRNFIGLVETGERGLSDRTIDDICRTYNVNKDWLVFGTGKMFRERSRNQQILSFANEVMEDSDDSLRKRLLIALSKMDESDWETLNKLVNALKKEDCF